MCKFSPTRPNKRQTFYIFGRSRYKIHPGFGVLCYFHRLVNSGTIISSPNSHWMPLHDIGGGMSFCDARDSPLFRVDPIQQIFRVQGVVFVKTKTCPVRVTRLAGSVLMLCNLCDFARVLCAIYRCMLHQHAGLPFAGGWQVLALVNLSQRLLDLFFGGHPLPSCL